ncbi:2OG-Fe dioxygenase family protein [Mycobacterium europaeum]|uniref:2OG-Fe dioxygenase family protein n=1 Tax=Mycobacterium europaeum TaxID=761804 RepID=UPI002AE07424|nr:2OG-Fe dioxygenase family protein [Mycobacterium europaeum]MEA1159833.1 2OG-Fe dioxygenase family protein [Mycobacterium europaeum]
MTRILSEKRADADPVAAAARLVATTGAAVVSSFDVTRSLGAGREEWPRFARHWQHLGPDPYAAELGVQRQRRYGQYSFRDRELRPMPRATFAQPQNSNPLYIGRGRDFEPLTDAFARDRLLHKLIGLLARVAGALDDVADWNVKVHPFRTRSTDKGGHPTPEGMHRDGVTLVSSLLVGRRNAIGGQSTVCDLDGRQLLATTLAVPGTLMLGDDRRTLHGVSPIRPIDGSGPAQRDVLVITFASAWP